MNFPFFPKRAAKVKPFFESAKFISKILKFLFA